MSSPIERHAICHVLLGVVAWALAGCTGPPERGSLDVFVVLDTVQADHLSACGYGRPTSPVLEGLVASGASLSCTAIAPGSWTLPSHASLFTGVEVPAHGAHALSVLPTATAEEGQRSLGPARALPARFETLAEQRPAVMVSANPVLGPSSGLSQGFRSARVPKHFGDWTREGLVAQVRAALRDEVVGGDLLFVNIADAHQPWPDVPDGLGWLPARQTLRYQPKRAQSLWRRYHNGDRPDGLPERLVDLYDHALWQADRALGEVLEEVERAGFTVGRLVVTADHGEHLGEHGLLGHGHYLNDENQVVPLLTNAGPLPDGPISATLAYDLIRGAPLSERPARAAAWPHATKRGWFDDRLYAQQFARSWAPAARWSSDVPVPEGPFGDFVRAVQRSEDASGGEAELAEQLEALGYF